MFSVYLLNLCIYGNRKYMYLQLFWLEIVAEKKPIDLDFSKNLIQHQTIPYLRFTAIVS